MTPDLWCTACHATIREAKRKMPPPKLITEGDVYEAFSGVDEDPYTFVAYSFTPPTMAFAVGRFVDEFEELIDPRDAWPQGSSVEEAFVALHKARQDPEEGICAALCEGVEFIPPEQRAERINDMQRQHRRRKAELKRMKAEEDGEELPPEQDDAAATPKPFTDLLAEHKSRKAAEGRAARAAAEASGDFEPRMDL